jgi:glutamine synthetase
MPGMLSFDELAHEVASGAIDTVVAAFPDMQGRLIGKRFHAEYFVQSAHDETHACDYLLANDIEMEPVPGYKVASWEKGYGDLVMKPDLSTLRRIPWLEKTALVPVRHPQPPRPFAARARPAQRAQAPAGTPARAGDEGVFRLRARVLPVRRDL